MTTITRGDDVSIPITLLDSSGAARDVSAATISASLVSVASGSRTSYVGPAAQAAGATGADWANGVVIAQFAAADTVSLPAGDTIVLLELQITLAGERQTKWAEVFVREGTIT